VGNVTQATVIEGVSARQKEQIFPKGGLREKKTASGKDKRHFSDKKKTGRDRASEKADTDWGSWRKTTTIKKKKWQELLRVQGGGTLCRRGQRLIV